MLCLRSETYFYSSSLFESLKDVEKRDVILYGVLSLCVSAKYSIFILFEEAGIVCS